MHEVLLAAYFHRNKNVFQTFVIKYHVSPSPEQPYDSKPSDQTYQEQLGHNQGKQRKLVGLPDKCAAPVTSTQGTNAVITWTAPTNDGGSTIIAYLVEIWCPYSLTMNEETVNCDGSNPNIVSAKTCIIPLAVLQAAPFSITVGNYIQATVKAINANYIGPSSEFGSQGIMIGPPNVPLFLNVQVNTNIQVTISWTTPSGNGGSAITGYTVAIMKSDLTYNNQCIDITATTCIVTIAALQTAPYNLVWGSSVFATVLATNIIGSSATSAPNLAVKITTNPDAPTQLANNALVTSATAIGITWLAPLGVGGTPITNYIVEWDSGIPNQWAALALVSPPTTVYTKIQNFIAATSYSFRIKSVNAFGNSLTYSNSVQITPQAIVPSTPSAPTTAIFGSNVVIDWLAPSDGGSVITGYTVQILQSDGTTYTAYTGCTGTAVSCTVAISVLRAAPYNLASGFSVYARVEAKNAFGSSGTSLAGNGAIIPATATSTPSAPNTSISGSNVLINWVAPADGGSAITGYTVEIRQSDGITFTALASCSGSTISCQIPITVLKSAPYNLAEGASIYALVIATNLIGSSSASTPGNGAVIVSQNQSMFLPSMKLNAVIGKEASLLLPQITGVSYIVLGKPRYQVSVNGLLLKVKSDSDSDISSHKLVIDAQTSSQSSNITVNVIFSNVTTTSETANKTSKTENLVLSVQESDSLLETTTSCNTTEAGILPCVTDIGFQYSIDPSKPTKAAQSEVLPQRPTMSVSRVNSLGSFFIKFSQAMNILALKNTTNDGKLQEVNATTQTDSTDKYRYLLSPKNLRIEVKSENATKAKFTWYAKNITSTKIEMQLVFKDPLSISNDRSSRDMLVITVLPPALRYFQTLASGALTKNPLQTLALRLPPQSILGTAMNSVSKVAKIIEESGQYTALANLAAQLSVSGSMGNMWSMLNAFQIVNTFNYLETNAPGNVRQVMNNLNDMLELSALETDQITSSLFNFTETQSPGAGFTEMGNDSKVLTAFIGNLFYIGVLILLVYLLYFFVHGCGYSDRRCKRFDLWLQPKLIWSALICYQLETQLDFGIGTLLKFEEPNLNTTGDIFDLGLSIAAVLLLLVLPLTQVIFLCKNKGQIDNLKFKQKWGSLYSDLKTSTPGQRETAIKMFVWLLLRRIVTALNLVELRNQTVWIQLSFNMWLCLADTCLILHWSPYQNKTRDIMEKFNGAVVLLLSQLVWMQTDLISSEEDRYYIGWYYLGVLAVMFVANIQVVVISALKYPKDQFKRCLLKRKQKKALFVKLQKLAQKNSKLTQQKKIKAQKNGLPPGTVVDEPTILSRRTLLVQKIKVLKRKPTENHDQFKQLAKNFVYFDNIRAEKQFKDGALINAKIQHYARSRTSTSVKVGVQPSKQIDNRQSKVKLRELLERQAAEAKLKQFKDQRQKELEIRKKKELKEEEQAKILVEERQHRINEVNSQWLGSIAYKIQQKMEEDAVLQFQRNQKIEELKRSDALNQQKNSVSSELNMWLNKNYQEIYCKREEDAIFQFDREQKREKLKQSYPRRENQQLPSKILFRRKYFEEEQRRNLGIYNKLRNKEQISEQEMSKIDLELQNPRPQLRRGTDAEFSFRAYK